MAIIGSEPSERRSSSKKGARTSKAILQPLLQASKPNRSQLADAAALPNFEESASSTLARLRNAMEQVIHSICRGLHNSRDLQNLIAVDRNLSWQVFKMLGPVDTLSTLPYVPAASSMAKLLAAVKKLGVSAERIQEAAAAFAAFETLVRTTAGDRERFETMVMSFADTNESRQIDLQHRKAAFRSHSHFFGLEVDAVVNSFIFHPSDEGNTFDLVSLLDLVGMRRLRLDTDVMIHGIRCGDKSDDFVPAYGTLNDKAAELYNAPLIPEFCTSPVPPLETVTLSTGMRRTMLKSREIGVGKEIDLATGIVFKGVSLCTHAEEGEYFGALVDITRPTKLLVVDLIVPKSKNRVMSHYAATYAHAPSDKPMPDVEREGVRMPMREQFLHLGSGLDACRTRDVPRYPDLIAHAAAKMNWQVEDFEIYRIRVDYPLMDTTLVLRVGSGA